MNKSVVYRITMDFTTEAGDYRTMLVHTAPLELPNVVKGLAELAGDKLVNLSVTSHYGG